jgi:diguanylate cyclase (GGDEF)-like protein/PAS domain S-box-containing protein
MISDSDVFDILHRYVGRMEDTLESIAGNRSVVSRICALSRDLFAADRASVGVINDGQWLTIAGEGTEPPDRHPMDAWFDYVRMGSTVMIVEDMPADPRLADMPFGVRGDMPRFYAGAPLILAGGIHFGTLSVMADQPRSPDRQQIRIFGQVAETLVAELQRRARNGVFIGGHDSASLLQQKMLAVQAEESEAFAQAVLESTTDNVIAFDRSGRVAYLNGHAREYFTSSRPICIGDFFWDVFPEYPGSGLAAGCQQALTSRRPTRFEVFARSTGVWLDVSACPSESGLTCFFSDVTERVRMRDELRFLADHDPLTGLVNRPCFNRDLQDRLTSEEGSGLHVILLDLDHFKEVNDTHGHPVGDLILKEVARRLQAVVGPGDVIARLGGDEFGVIHQGDPAHPDPRALAVRLLSTFNEALSVGEVTVRLAASMGIATRSADLANAEALLQAADIALYRAKDDGRGTIRVFDAPMARRVAVRQSMKSDLVDALERGELRLVYQPLLDIPTGRIVGTEALLRWRHPVHGNVPPSTFIPLAEETGLIGRIGKWVLMTACHQSAAWSRDLTIAINISPLQLRDDTFSPCVMAALSSARLPHDRLELEITESMFMAATDRTVSTLRSLRKTGVRIALDDFGVGYSSLSYLRDFPFDKLKLDRGFVNDIGRSPQTEAIIRAAGDMGRALSMTTTAEGVETREQLEWLQLNGWSQAQGFHVGHPMEAAAMTLLMAQFRDEDRAGHPRPTGAQSHFQ